ncbi:MAG: hypothetical protein JXJ18_00945 [Rhodobacteraceae bacterium]|nr:hypothetical protein [Paracoccaceae bacterium]
MPAWIDKQSVGGAAVAATLLCAGMLWAEPRPCPDDPMIRTEAESPAREARICAIVAAARPGLAACHLQQGRALDIQVVPEITHPNAACMGTYDCRDERIRITHPDALGNLLTPDSIWRRIPPEALFASLIVHELAHAFLDQAECTGVPCLADHEYIAYALQIDSLSPANRAAVLRGHTVPLPVDPTRLNGFIALAAPNRFAQSAWLHFAQPENGCDFVGRLIRGEITLELPPI